MKGFWLGISLISVIYLTILFISESLVQVISVAAMPFSLICLIISIVIGNLISLPSSWVRGTNYIKKNILQIAIVFLGLKMSLSQVLEVGFSSLTLIVIIFILVFVFSAVLKRIFFKEKDLITLISIGTVICGITAIIASNSVLRSKEQDVVIAVLIVNLHDNPEGTGTKFVNNPYEKHTYENYKENLWYEGPTKKGTGLFFLNNWNTWHRIENDTGKTRYIAYETLHVSQMLRR